MLFYRHLNINTQQGILDEFNDINATRKRYGRQPVQLDQNLNKIAQIRAKQAFLVEYIQHHDDDQNVHEEIGKNNEENTLLQQKLGLTNVNSGENVCSLHPISSNFKDGNYGTFYYNNLYNSKQMANAVNNDSMYHDQSNQNGHRNNILDPNYQYVGIAMYYQPYTHEAIFVEDYVGG